MGWKDVLAKITELVYRAVRLADDLAKVQSNVEKLQEQTYKITSKEESQNKTIDQIKAELVAEIAKITRLSERLSETESELQILKGLNAANNEKQIQEIEPNKFRMEQYIRQQVDERFNTLKIEMINGLREALGERGLQGQPILPRAIPSHIPGPDGNDNN